MNTDSRSRDVTVDIPLTPVASDGRVGARKGDSPSKIAVQETFRSANETSKGSNEKSGLFHRRGGMRKARRENSEPRPVIESDEEEGTLTRMGRIYNKILNFSIVTRYFVYVLPLGILFAVPIVVGATAARKAELGDVRIMWIFAWVEVVWLALWVSKIFAKCLPWLFQFICGVVSSGTRKYASLLEALEIPISLVGWAVVALVTFGPLVKSNRHAPPPRPNDPKPWVSNLNSVLFATLVATIVYLVEKFLIQMISINYHRKQFNSKIKISKRNVHLLGILYDASRSLFPAYCPEFAEEDYIINDSLGTGKKGSQRGSVTPMRLIQNVGRVGDKLTSAFGNIASEITGKQVFNPNSAHSIVVEALEKKKSSEALAKRLWMSFVVEGKDALYMEDLVEVLGESRRDEAGEAFAAVDRDGNGDVSLDEMSLTVVEIGRERKSIASSMHDVDQAINVLDKLLQVIAFIIVLFIFVAFLNKNFTTTLATAGTALLSMSFVFAVTAQEVLGSCIFLFVKHPYDVGDRVDIDTVQLTVEHISLLFSVFRRVDNHKTVQIPNQLLNQKWVENITRSKAMRETVLMHINFDTTLEDIQLLRDEMQKFVLEHNRDFQPDIDIELTGIASMDKLELKVEIRHKSNWSNETLRASRRSKFMCALVLALRKVPVYGPGAGDPILGDIGKPTYAVAITDTEAVAQREEFAREKEAKRLVPSKKSDDKSPEDKDSPTMSKGKPNGGDTINKPSADSSGWAAVAALNARNATFDPARDDWRVERDEAATLAGRTSSDTRRGNDVDESQGLLRKAPSQGRRKRDSHEGTSQQPQGLMLSGVEQRSSTEAEHSSRGPMELPTHGGLTPQQYPERTNSPSPAIPPEYQQYLQGQSSTSPDQPGRRTPQGQGQGQNHPGSLQQTSWLQQPPQPGWRP
ncbi:MAG: hypothetical protein M1840_001531 [Geoglossum simile]|nr:MAG: hypothetical protein M1840_001531 [Geoglossum simile]